MKLVSSHWHKQNLNMWKYGFTLAAGIAIVIQMLSLRFGFERQSSVFAFRALLVGVIVLIIIVRKYASSMTRVVKFEYSEIERDFRLLFKENHIQFNRRAEESGYQYDFVGRDLRLTIEHYRAFDIRKVRTRPFTKVRFTKINAENQAFAENLAGLIDKMVAIRAVGG